jgi:hypothetical protein
MTSEQLATVILAIFGVLLQLALLYAPKFSTWYQGNANKGLLALGFSALIGLAYFGLSCTSFAGQFSIQLACTQDSVFVLLKAIYTIAITQTAAYVILPKYSKG